MTETDLPVCGLCGSQAYQRLHRIRGLWIYHCSGCGVLFTFPRFVYNYNASSGLLEERLRTYRVDYWPKRRISAMNFLVHAAKYKQTGNLLDIGCGFGFFLNEARQAGWNARGVEIARDQALWAKEHFNLEVEPSLENNTQLQFDVITLWDVIEHIPDPGETIAACYRLLRPGGLLFIKTPNAGGLLVKPNGWKKAFFPLYLNLVYPANPREHLFHYTDLKLTEILREFGFSAIKIDFNQHWNERILVGRHRMIVWLRMMLMWISWKNHLPYEMSIWADRKS